MTGSVRGDPPPPTDVEVGRIRAVYGQYRGDPRTLAKWNPRNPGNVLIHEELHAAIMEFLARGGARLEAARILDVGCGSGGTLGWLAERGVHEERLYGVDLRDDQLTLARARYPGVRLFCADARRLPFPDRFFDVVLCNVVFSSILDQTVAEAVSGDLLRVLKPTGMIVWSDNRYRNPWNPNVRGYTSRAIRKLFPGCRMELRSITVLPPLARRLGRLTSMLYPLLARIPALRVKYVGLIQPLSPAGHPCEPTRPAPRTDAPRAR